jgi:hypothetical protein
VSVRVREHPTTIQVSRMQRFEARSRQRHWLGLALVIVVVIGGGAWFVTSRPTARPTTLAPPPAAPGGEVDSMVLAVQGAGQPLVAVIGGGPSAVTMPIPAGLRIEALGLGQSSTLGDVVSLPGDAMRIAVSNALGMWVDHYAVTDVQRLGVLAGRGGLVVTLPQAVTIGDRVIGPGAVTMNASLLTHYLAALGPDLPERWDVVLTAITAAPPVLKLGDLLESDDLGATSALLASARGANIETFPSHVVAGTVLVPDYGALDALVSRVFGTNGPVVRVIVQNGSGAPNVGQVVARALVPLGFRIVLTENSDAFDAHQTAVIAIGQPNVPAAQRAQRALGVGTVELSKVPSGIGDITIDVGRDLSS